jgi:thiamine kinase-like enzyme
MQLCERLKALNDGDANKLWPFTVTHGDFAPWNMRMIDGKVALFDWEYFIPLAPAGWDILYFIFRVENLIKQKSLEQIWSKFESGAYLGSLELWENQARIQVPDRRLLAMFVLISLALDLVPKWICRENDL